MLIKESSHHPVMRDFLYTHLPPLSIVLSEPSKEDHIEICRQQQCLPPIKTLAVLQAILKPYQC